MGQLLPTAQPRTPGLEGRVSSPWLSKDSAKGTHRLCRCETVAAVGPGYVWQTEMAFGLQFEGAVRHHEGGWAAEAQGS